MTQDQELTLEGALAQADGDAARMNSSRDVMASLDEIDRLLALADAEEKATEW